jgi:hypothetical protein
MSVFKVAYPAVSQIGLDRSKWKTHAHKLFASKAEAVAFAKIHGTQVVEQKVY